MATKSNTRPPGQARASLWVCQCYWGPGQATQLSSNINAPDGVDGGFCSFHTALSADLAGCHTVCRFRQCPGHPLTDPKAVWAFMPLVTQQSTGCCKFKLFILFCLFIYFFSFYCTHLANMFSQYRCRRETNHQIDRQTDKQTTK